MQTMTANPARIARPGIRSKLTAAWALYAGHPRWTAMRVLGRFDLLPALLGAVPYPRDSMMGRDDAPSLLEGADVNTVVQGLNAHGCHLGLRLSEKVVEEVTSFAHATPCFADSGEPSHGVLYEKRFDSVAGFPGSVRTASYRSLAEQCPAVTALTRDPKILAIAAAYLRGTPVLLGTILWWSFAGASTKEQMSRAAQLFHFDLDDYRFLKFFFYLTDVNEGTGPHVAVRGTHRRKKLRHQLLLRRHSDEEIAAAYGAENIMTICGPAGSGFAEDTRCFHKGTNPRSGDRLLLQLQFGRTDYGLQHER